MKADVFCYHNCVCVCVTRLACLSEVVVCVFVVQVVFVWVTDVYKQKFSVVAVVACEVTDKIECLLKPSASSCLQSILKVNFECQKLCNLYM